MTRAMPAHDESDLLRSHAAMRGVRVGMLQVVGDDARTWLQGQITADVSVPKMGSATYALVVTAQGKILTDLWSLDRGDSFSLVVEPERLEALRVHLDRFIVMDDVELHGEIVDAYALEGPLLQSTKPHAEERWPVRWLSATGQLSFVRPDLPEVSAATWELERIRLGIPRMGVDFGEATLPQEVGLRAAVSFAKGCYVGQEPIVMLEHRGKPPRRLVSARLEGAAKVGAEVGNTMGRGRVTSVASSGSSTFLLALVPRKALDAPLEAEGRPLLDVRVVERLLADAT